MSQQNKNLNFLVEGNIGAGKSTFVDKLNGLQIEDREIKIIPEPVNIWTSYSGHNYLQYFYDNPRKWTFTFQQLVLNTAANVYKQSQQIQSENITPKVNFFERSMYSPTNIFAKQQYKTQVLCDAEMDLLHKITDDTCSWIDYDIQGIIYVRTDPNVTLERMQRRNRKEDCTLPLGYLQDLHDLHDEWLFGENKTSKLPVLVYENNSNLTINNFIAVQEQIKQWVLNPVDMVISSSDIQSKTSLLPEIQSQLSTIEVSI